MTIEAINEIMTALGPAEDDILVVLRTGETEWMLRYAEADVEISVVEGEGRVVFSALCGVPPEGRAAAVHALLLRANALWRETGSVRMALSGDDAEAVVIADIHVSRATQRHVALIARNVADRSVAWRQIVEGGVPDTTPAAINDINATIFRL